MSLTVRLDDTTAAVLEAEARRTRRSKGKIVRDAILTHVRSERKTALDALAEYVGIMSGPADLSTNKRHLAGLGKPRARRRK